MTPGAILAAATQAGVVLSVRAGTVYAAPSGRLPAELKDEIRSHKAAIIAALPPEPAPLVCYWCRGVDFWQSPTVTVCRNCHPPAPGAERPATTSTRTDGARGGAA